MTLQEHILILSQNTGISPLSCMVLAVVKGAYPEAIAWDQALSLAGADATMWKDTVRVELHARDLLDEDGLSVTATEGLMSIDAIPTKEKSSR